MKYYVDNGSANQVTFLIAQQSWKCSENLRTADSKDWFRFTLYDKQHNHLFRSYKQFN